jgi:fumarate reductase subunit D
MGLVDPTALEYSRAHSLASSGLGRLVLLGLIAPPLWKGAHHMRSLSVDFNGGDRDGVVGGLLYAAAAICSLLGILAIIRL